MTTTVRSYLRHADFDRVGAFLVETYQADRQPANWLQPRWEYMHYLCVPYCGLTAADLEKIGIWEDAGHIVGVVHFEERIGQAYFEVHPSHTDLKPEMLDYAENHLRARRADGSRLLRAFMSDFDTELTSLVHARGYRRNDNAG